MRQQQLNYRPGGFTLVELLVVLVIVGVAAAMVSPQIGSQNDLLAAAAARSVIADLTYAQNRAILLKKKSFVQFSAQQYTLLSRDSDSAALQTINNPVTNETYITAFGSANGPMRGVSLASENFGGATVIGFDELGAPFAYSGTANACTALSTAGSIALSCGSTTLAVVVQPYTGEIAVN